MQKKALIVDDDETLLSLLSILLKKEGWKTFQLTDGRKCLQAIEDFSPDIILLDYSLPGMDGLEILTRIKELGYNTPVIVITASILEELPENFLKAGAFDYLTKPIKKSDLTFSTTKAWNYKNLWDRLSKFQEKDYNFTELGQKLEKVAEGSSDLEMGKYLLLDRQKSFVLEEFLSLFLSKKQQMAHDISHIGHYLKSDEKEKSGEADSAYISLKNVLDDFDFLLEKTVKVLEELKIRKEQFDNEG